MNPVLEQADPIQVEMINVQENPTCADRYGVNRLPTAILTDGEKIVDYVGMPDVEKAVNFLRGRHWCYSKCQLFDYCARW